MNGQDMKQFLDGVVDLAVKGRGVDVVELPGKTEFLVYNRAAGTYERVDMPIPPHRTQLDSPEALVAFVKDAPGLMGPNEVDARAVFVNEGAVVFQSDLDARRDRATCKLVPSPQAAWLRQWGGKLITQRELIRILRITFGGCGGESVLAVVRNLKFTNNAAGAANIEHGRQSMGRSVLAEVTGVDAIPESLWLDIPLFENFPKRFRVQLAIEVDPQNETIGLTPFPLVMSEAMRDALAAIADLFKLTEVPVFFGSAGTVKGDAD